ncbi:MAG: ABC transporter ATP-binding protein [Acidimicrobiales bacterium]|nr:ABC transporter ATP-binding protein [Acidimicrobiales bacterium]
MTGPLLSVRDLEVSYGTIPAVRGVSLDVGAADRVAIVGRNGAGKTSTLRAIAGITPAKGGRIEYDGVDITRQAPGKRLARGLALVPEGRGLFGQLTVEENLVMGAYHRDLRGPALAEEMERVTERFPRVRERMSQLANSMSGGEQQMLAIARGLMTAPSVLVVDEPSLGLSPVLVDEIYELFAALSAEGTAVVVVEQYVALALRFARHAYVLDKGAVALAGDASELSANPDLVDVYMAAV